MDSVARRFRALFQIQPGEGKRVAVMMLYSAAALGAVSTVSMTVASALFLSTIPSSYTAGMLAVAGIGLFVVMLLYEQFVPSFSMERVATATPLVLLGVVLTLRLLLSTPLGSSLPVLVAIYVFYEVVTLLILLQFWTLAGQIFNPREAKRLFGLIAGGGTLSNIVAGFSVAALGRQIGVANLLWIVAGGLLVCAFCAAYVGRLKAQMGRPKSPVKKKAPPSLPDNLRAVWRLPLLRTVVLLTVLTALLINLGLYQYMLALQSAFAGESASMVTFLGRYEVIAGIAALFVQFYLTGRIMNRFGLFVALAALPTAMVFAEGVSLMAGGAIVAVALVRGANPVLRRTIDDAAKSALFLPVQDELAVRARSLMKLIYSLTFGLLGLVLFLVPQAGTVNYLFYAFPILLIGIGWLLLTPRLRRNYIDTLGQSLDTRRLDLAGQPLEVEDETTRGVLVATLQHPNELQVLHALQLLATAPDPLWLPHVIALLDHPSTEVQVASLRYLEAHGTPLEAPLVAGLLNEATPSAVRAAAIRAYCALAGVEALARVSGYLEASDPATRGAAVAGLIRHTGLDGIIHAASTLKTMLASHRVPMRESAARLLGELKINTLQAALLALFDDAALSVRLAAIDTAGKLLHPALLEPLVGKLGVVSEGRAAARALIAFGDAALPPLTALWMDPDAALSARAEVPTLLGRIGTPAARQWLVARLDEPQEELLRGALYRALIGMPGAPADTLPRAALDAAMQRELRLCYEWQLLGQDLKRGEPMPLLQEAVQVRLRHTLDRLLDLLSLRYGTSGMGHVRRALMVQGGSQSAMAVELLDNVAERAMRALLLPLVEGPPDAVAQAAKQHFGVQRRSVGERLAQLREHPEPWLREVVRYYASEPSPLIATPLLLATVGTNGYGDSPMLSTIERVLLLKGVDFFHSFDSEELVPVAAAMEEVTFETGERFIAQGDVGDCFYILAAGEASIVIRGVGEVARRGPRDAIGEMAVISHEPRTADCVALSPLTALRLDSDVFWELLAEKPVLSQGVIRVLAARLTEAVSNLQRLGNGSN